MRSKNARVRTAATLAAQAQAQETVRRMMKLAVVTLHEEFGFGKDRIAQFVDAFNKICAHAEHDEVFWGHIDHIVATVGVKTQPERDG